jgi:hypothetical protein
VRLLVTLDGASQQDPFFATDWTVLAPGADWPYWFPRFDGFRATHGMTGAISYEAHYGHAEGAYRYSVAQDMTFEIISVKQADGNMGWEVPLMNHLPPTLADLPAAHLSFRRPLLDTPSPRWQRIKQWWSHKSGTT